MSWNESKESEANVEAKVEAVVAPSTPESSSEPAQVEEAKVESTAVVSEEKKEEAPAVKEEKQPEPMVPQRLIGKIAKEIREKSRATNEATQQRVRELEEENRRLKTQPNEWTEPAEKPAEDIAKVAREAARVEFLQRQDAYGREKYGKDYDDALLLIGAQKDPHLAAKIQQAANPADALMREAVKLAEELEYGANPEEREKKKLEALKANWRKEWEAEMSSKLAARTNQPTDVQNVRAAGGDAKPAYKQETWENSLPR